MATTSISASSVNLPQLEQSSINRVVATLSKSYEKISAQVDSTSVKVSALGQIQSGLDGIKTKSADLQDSAKVATATDARTALESMFSSINTQVSLVSSLTARASSEQSAGVLATESKLKNAGVGISQTLDTSGLYGATVLSGMGISRASDGSLTVDAATFEAAYAADSDKVKAALADIGGAINSKASTELNSGGSVYSSSSRIQTQYNSLVERQNTLADRMNNLQYGGAEAATVSDYLAITSVAAAAANSIGKLQSQADTFQTQVNTATAKSTALSSVRSSSGSLQTAATTIQDSASTSTVNDARAALQSVVTAANTQLSTLASASASGAALEKETGVLNDAYSVTNMLKGSNIFGGLQLGNLGVSFGSNGQFSLDQGTFDAAYGADSSGVQTLLQTLGASLSQSITDQLASDGALATAESKSASTLNTLNTRLDAINLKIQQTQDNPLLAASATLYKQVLAL